MNNSMNRLGTIALEEIKSKKEKLARFKHQAEESKTSMEAYLSRARRCENDIMELEQALDVLTRPEKAVKKRKKAA